ARFTPASTARLSVISASVAESVPLPLASQMQNLPPLHCEPPTAALRIVSASEALTMPSPLTSPQMLPGGSDVVVVVVVVVVQSGIGVWEQCCGPSVHASVVHGS